MDHGLSLVVDAWNIISYTGIYIRKAYISYRKKKSHNVARKSRILWKWWYYIVIRYFTGSHNFGSFMPSTNRWISKGYHNCEVRNLLFSCQYFFFN